MKVKKLIAFTLSAAMLAATLTGCVSGEKKTNETKETKEQQTEVGSKIELTYWSSMNKDTTEPIVEEFNKSQDKINVTMSYYSADGLKDACKVAASSKTLPNMWFNWGGSLGTFYVQNGLAYDLTDYASENKWSEKFASKALELATLDGKVSGYPNAFNVLGVYYRKDIFEKYNIAVPKTFEEFESACAVLKENGITPISTGGLYGWHTMRFVELLIEHYAGAELHDKMNTFEESYNNEAVIKAFQKYKEFCDKGYFPQGFVTQDPNDTFLSLAKGQCAMDIQGQWYDGLIIENEQDINKYGVFAFPSGETSRMSAFDDMIQFNAGNSEEEVDACVDFLDFYYGKEMLSEYPGNYTLPLPVTEAEMPDGKPNVPIMMETAENNGIFTITDQAFPTEVADVLFNAQEAIANGMMEPEDAAKSIQDAIEAYNKK